LHVFFLEDQNGMPRTGTNMSQLTLVSRPGLLGVDWVIYFTTTRTGSYVLPGYV